MTITISELGVVNATSIEVYASASKNATYQKLEVNGTKFSFTTDEVNGDFKVCEVANPGELTSIVLKKTNASNTSSQQGFIFINKIVVTYGAADTRLDAGLKFSATEVEANLGEAFDKPTLTKATTAEVVYSSSDEAVATVDATTGEVTLVAAGTTTITASAPANEEYKAGTASYTLTVIKPVVETTVALATEMTDGKFVLYTPQGVAKNYTGSNAFGYLFLEAVTPENNEFKVNEDYLIEFTNTDKGYTMKDCNGKFLGMDATHFGSFNFYDSADADGSNCYWTATFDGNNDVKIENAGRAGAYISYKQYKDDWEIVTTDNADQPLVQLYKVKDVNTAIEDIEAADAPVEYYNLQGIRVANPTSGRYFKRQGNKVTKVIL